MKSIVLVLALALVAGCDDDSSYTLYRTSALGAMRIHVASFDIEGEADDYNQNNCETVVRALANEPGVPEGYYWCEAGPYRD